MVLVHMLRLKTAIVVCLAIFLLDTVTSAEELRFVITETSKNTHVDAWKKTGDGWSVEKKTLRGGKQDGVDLITVDNGEIEIDIVPTRGMSIYQIRRGDLRIGWDAPVETLVHPRLVDLESRGGLGWLEGFNEWMVRCGLEFAGHPGTDEFTTNTGETSSMDLTLHGKIGNIPANKVEIFVTDGPSPTIRVVGSVAESFFYGPKLHLETEVVVEKGKPGFQIHDVITNRGSAEQEFQIIYHANFGRPLLGEGATVHAAVKKLSPMNEHAAQSIDHYSVYAGPSAGFVEEVFLIEPNDESGLTGAVLANAAGDTAASMHWRTSELPYLTLWKNTAALEDGYVTGIEPATGYPYNRMVERKAGRVPKLAAGASREFHIDFMLHEGEAEVKRAIEAIQGIQAGRKMVVNRKPLN